MQHLPEISFVYLQYTPKGGLQVRQSLFIVHSSGLLVEHFNQTKNFSSSSGISGGLSRCFGCGVHVRFVKFFVLFLSLLATLHNKSSSEIHQVLIAASI